MNLLLASENQPQKDGFILSLMLKGITYEIGDDTPRDFIKIKGQTSAKEMMKLLLENNKK